MMHIRYQIFGIRYWCQRTEVRGQKTDVKKQMLDNSIADS